MENACFCETSMRHILFLNSSPDVWFDAILSLSSTDCSFDPRAWPLLWYAFSAVRHFIKTYMPFQIIPIQLNLPQDNFTRSAVTSTSNMNTPELRLMWKKGNVKQFNIRQQHYTMWWKCDEGVWRLFIGTVHVRKTLCPCTKVTDSISWLPLTFLLFLY